MAQVCSDANWGAVVRQAADPNQGPLVRMVRPGGRSALGDMAAQQAHEGRHRRRVEVSGLATVR